MDPYSPAGRRRLHRRRSARSGEPLQRRRSMQTKASHRRERALTPRQVHAIREVMRIFVEDDLANGVPPGKRLFCHACEASRPAAGFIKYGRLAFCNACAVEYEMARARALVGAPEEFLRRAGEARLAPALEAQTF